MALSFIPLAELLEKKNLTWYDLHELGVSHMAINRLKRNKNVSTKIIAQVCDILHCKPGDIMRVIGDDEGYVDITTPANIDPSTLRHKYAFVSFNKPIDCISSMARTNVIYVADTPYAKFGLYAEGFIRFDTADDGSHVFPAAAIKMVKLRKLTESEFETYCKDNKIYDTSLYHLK